MEYTFFEPPKLVEQTRREMRHSANWRSDVQAKKWPDDWRNRVAAAELERLAECDFDDVDPTLWAEIESRSESPTFRQAISATNRDVVFKFKCEDLNQYFGRVLSKLPN